MSYRNSGMLKENWKKKRIEQCFKIKSGDFLPANKMAKEGNIDVYGGNGITGKHDLHNLTGENIIIGRVGAKCGNVKRVNRNIWVTDNAFYISELIEEFDLRFLEYLLNQINLRNTANQTAQPVISYTTIKHVVLVIPPLAEQKRIVAILDEVFEGCDRAIRNTENNFANARELFESYRNSILTQNNKEWQETTLGNEIDLMTGFPFKSNQYTDSEQSIRLLRGDNIIQGVLRWDDVKKWSKSNINGFLVYQLKEGDVVLAMDRPWVKAGLKHAMISIDDLPCLLVQRTACLRAKNMSNRFLMYSIGSHSFIQHILSNQTGIGVPHISGKQIQSFKLLKPPLSEQLQISDNLDKLYTETQRLETIYSQKLSALKELKQSILQKAFTGELTADKEVA